MLIFSLIHYKMYHGTEEENLLKTGTWFFQKFVNHPSRFSRNKVESKIPFEWIFIYFTSISRDIWIWIDYQEE